MRTPQVIEEAFRALSTNRLRTSLTMLGVIIGVCAVVIMLAVGRGTQSMVNQTISSMGSNLLVVFPGSQTSGGVRFGAGAAQTSLWRMRQRLNRSQACCVLHLWSCVVFSWPMATPTGALW